MKIHQYFFILLSFVLVSISHTQTGEEGLKAVYHGEYLGQEKPGLTAKPFAPELLERALGLAFAPDGKELFYALWGVETRAAIMMMKMVDEKWTEPATAPFSGKYMDWDLNLSPDGKRLYFSSQRPLDGEGEPKDGDIWFVEKSSNGGWGEPQNLGEPVNTDENEVHPTVSSDGTLYFFAGYEGGVGSADIYRSRFMRGRYTKPENIGAPINTGIAEMDPVIAPDGSYLIFHSRMEGGCGENDLYISFRNGDGSWAQPVNMGERINTDQNDYCGRVSLDGRYFFFKRRGQDVNATYWIDAKVIEELRIKFTNDR